VIPVAVARILVGARMLWRSFIVVSAVLVGIGIAVQCSGCATAAKVASVVEPVARVTCAIARKVTAACDVAFPETAADAACPVVAESETTGDEVP
jgi:hypothetical protein